MTSSRHTATWSRTSSSARSSSPRSEMKMKALLALLALGATATIAHAADNGFYVGAGVGSSKYDLEDALDDSDMGFKLIAGVRLLDSFAVEANFLDFGKAALPADADAKAQALGIFAVGFLDFPLLDLFAKAGLSRTDAQINEAD